MVKVVKCLKWLFVGINILLLIGIIWINGINQSIQQSKQAAHLSHDLSLIKELVNRIDNQFSGTADALLIQKHLFRGDEYSQSRVESFSKNQYVTNWLEEHPEKTALHNSVRYEGAINRKELYTTHDHQNGYLWLGYHQKIIDENTGDILDGTSRVSLLTIKKVDGVWQIIDEKVPMLEYGEPAFSPIARGEWDE